MPVAIKNVLEEAVKINNCFKSEPLSTFFFLSRLFHMEEMRGTQKALCCISKRTKVAAFLIGYLFLLKRITSIEIMFIQIR